jgi:hypothetical protein
MSMRSTPSWLQTICGSCIDGVAQSSGLGCEVHQDIGLKGKYRRLRRHPRLTLLRLVIEEKELEHEAE